MGQSSKGTQSFTRAGSLKEAIARIEAEYPQFREPGYRPSPESAEALAFTEYKSLSNALNGENWASRFSWFLEAKKKEDATADATLGRMGLSPVIILERHVLPKAQQGGLELTEKERRGEICEQVIREVKFLKADIRIARTSFTFSALKDKHPSLLVLKLVSERPFDDEDRHLISHPNQWGTGPVSYATGLLERYFCRKPETIKGYRRAHKARFKVSPPPLSVGKRHKPRECSKKF